MLEGLLCRHRVVAKVLRICSVWEIETSFFSLDIKLLKSVELTKPSSAQVQ